MKKTKDAWEIEHERFEEVLDKLVKSEVENKMLKDTLTVIKGVFQDMVNRPVVVTLTEEQVQKIIGGISAALIEAGKEWKH